MIAGNRQERALGEIGQVQTELKSSSPDLHFAQLEATLALWKAALGRKDEAMAGQWQKRVADTIEFIEQSYGSYWGRRARLAQLAVAQTGPASGGIDILVTSADELFRKQEYDQAIATYERAAERARATGDLQAASDIECTAARIEQQLSRHDAASRRLRRLALEQTSDPQSASKHLLATLNAALLVGTDPSATPRYQTLLEEHIATWPLSDTADRAREWLGNLCASQGNWEVAVQAYRAVTANADFYPKAIAAVSECYEQWLQARSMRTGQPIDNILADAMDFFDTLILGPEGRWPERWSPAQLTAALTSARLRLHYSHNRLVDAQRVLQAAMEHAPVNDKTWLQEAQSLLIVALAGQPGHQQDALRLLQQLGSQSLDRLLELIDRLSTLTENATPPVRTQIALVQLAALEQVKAGFAQLEQRQRLRVEKVRAEALHTLGRQAEALEVYRRTRR